MGNSGKNYTQLQDLGNELMKLQAKGGFKTRKKSNINRAVVVPRPRQKGRKNKKGK